MCALVLCFLTALCLCFAMTTMFPRTSGEVTTCLVPGWWFCCLLLRHRCLYQMFGSFTNTCQILTPARKAVSLKRRMGPLWLHIPLSQFVAAELGMVLRARGRTSRVTNGSLLRLPLVWRLESRRQRATIFWGRFLKERLTQTGSHD